MINISKIKEDKALLIISAALLILITYFGAFPSLSKSFTSPERELRWDTSVETGSTYYRGQEVKITGFLEEGSVFIENGQYYIYSEPENILYSVSVTGPDNMIYFFISDTRSDSIGDFSLDQVSFNIPSDAPNGLYSVRVLVWTQYLPIGETRTNNIIDSTFEVISE